jgi:hypothetical protein
MDFGDITRQLAPPPAEDAGDVIEVSRRAAAAQRFA